MKDRYIGITQPLNIISRAYANLDAKYVPYNSIENALENIPMSLRVQGLTVGIIIDNEIDEYWFSKGIENNNLILKFESVVGEVDLSIVEVLGNKQNNLSKDFSNKKYPTVSAVIEGLSLKVDKQEDHFLMTKDERIKLERLRIDVGGAKNLEELTNIKITSVQDGEFLKYDGITDKWVNSDITFTQYTAGTGIKLVGTQITANVGTAYNQVAAGNHVHENNHSHTNSVFLATIDQKLNKFSSPSFIVATVDDLMVNNISTPTKSVADFINNFYTMFELDALGKIIVKRDMYSVESIGSYKVAE